MPDQLSLLNEDGARSLLDRLITESRLYKTSKDYKELLDFVIRLRHIAPFNAMLLQIQKPGLQYAMSARDWREKFGRFPKEGTRPLVIMWPFGPVAFVYDVVDTDGTELPRDVYAFTATGNVDQGALNRYRGLLARKRISWVEIDQGDAHAGLVRVVSRSEETGNSYQVNINKNHTLPTQFTTLAHELGHMFLGHLGSDKKLKIKDRSHKSADAMEIEAESVAHLVCSRVGIEPQSLNYLSGFVSNEQEIKDLDIYAILVAAGAVESILELNPKAFRARME